MQARINKVFSLAKERNLDAILVSSVSNIIYLTGYDSFSYFEREAFLIITANKNYLITDGRYSEAVSMLSLPALSEAEGSKYELLEISAKNSLDNIFKSLSPKIKKIGIEENDISVSEHKKLRKYFKILPIKRIQDLRALKDKNEVAKIEKACSLGDKAFEFILKKLKTGVSEKEIAFEIETFIKKSEADISFPPIVAFGKNSSMPHHKTSGQRLKTNSIILLDFGVKLDNYCSDMTRTVFKGIADAKFKKIYNTVLESQQKAINYINLVGRRHPTYEVGARNIDKIARNYILKHGFPTIPHSLGHGIGIEVHEPPRLSPKSKDVLKPGMVFSIEPGIYLPAGRQGIPGYGGVRIEDLVVLENNKPRLLTHSPKNLLEI